MLAMHKLDGLLKIAKVRRADGLENSDEWVVRKLRQDRAERADLLSKIDGDELCADTALALKEEIAAIDHALTAYPDRALA